MTFPSSGFDIAIDKATLDAMLYGSLWDTEMEVRKNVGEYVDELRLSSSYFLIFGGWVFRANSVIGCQSSCAKWDVVIHHMEATAFHSTFA